MLLQVLMDLLKRPGINPNIQDENWDAPIHALVKSSHKDKVELLIALLTHSRADVNLRAADDMTALHFAVQVGRLYLAFEGLLLRWLLHI